MSSNTERSPKRRPAPHRNATISIGSCYRGVLMKNHRRSVMAAGALAVSGALWTIPATADASTPAGPIAPSAITLAVGRHRCRRPHRRRYTRTGPVAAGAATMTAGLVVTRTGDITTGTTSTGTDRCRHRSRRRRADGRRSRARSRTTGRVHGDLADSSVESSVGWLRIPPAGSPRTRRQPPSSPGRAPRGLAAGAASSV
jgi:hypothetical protein